MKFYVLPTNDKLLLTTHKFKNLLFSIFSFQKYTFRYCLIDKIGCTKTAQARKVSLYLIISTPPEEKAYSKRCKMNTKNICVAINMQCKKRNRKHK